MFETVGGTVALADASILCASAIAEFRHGLASCMDAPDELDDAARIDAKIRADGSN